MTTNLNNTFMKRKLINHIRHCMWMKEQIKEHNAKWYYKKKSYYFNKQIEVTQKLLKQLS